MSCPCVYLAEVEGVCVCSVGHVHVPILLTSITVSIISSFNRGVLFYTLPLGQREKNGWDLGLAVFFIANEHIQTFCIQDHATCKLRQFKNSFSILEAFLVSMWHNMFKLPHTA